MTDITQIIREHQDRWYKSGDNFYARVDKYSEGLGTVKDHLVSSTSLQPSNMYAIQISRNATTPDLTDKTPYGTYFCYDSDTTYQSSGTGSVYYTTLSTARNTQTVIALLNSGTFQYLQEGTDSNLWSQIYTIGSSTATSAGQTGILRAILITCNNTSSPSYFKAKFIYYTGDTYPYNYHTSSTVTFSYSGSIASTTNIFKFNDTRYLYTGTNTAYVRESLVNLDTLLQVFTPTEIKAGSYGAQIVTGLKNLDRTNSAIMAIYQVPKITMNTTNATFVEGYNLFKLKSYDQNYALPTAATIKQLYTDSMATPQNERSKVLETKLYNNEITDLGVYYQGDCLLNFDATRYNSLAIPTLYSSIRINEDNPQLMRFTFNCQQYNFTSTYEQYAFMATKYTVPLYTNEWTEYVRNGYNYDVAARQREKSLQGWNIALGAISAATSLGMTALGTSITASKVATETLTQDAQKEALERYKGLGYDQISVTPQEGSKGLFGVPSAYDISLRSSSRLVGTPTGGASTVAHATNKTIAKRFMESATTNSLGTMVVSQGVSSVNSLISAAYSIKTANANYQQTINAKAASHTAITGNNVDYKAAVDNKIEFQVWQPQEYILENIAKVFHLTGYSHPVQEVPNTKSRYWFNYLQCIPCWSESTINSYRPEFLNDLSEKYQSGVTIFHYKDGYDLDQEKENMEVNLI